MFINQKDNRIQNRIHLDVDLHPTTCNICGGEVEYVPNELIYGKPYGSGFSYLCKECGAHVGTEKDNPTKALGILADKYLRTSKGMTHDAIDPLWMNAGTTKKEKRKARIRVYHDLADRLGLDHRSCHIGFF